MSTDLIDFVKQLKCAEVKKMWMDLYIHSPIRLHGVVLN
jgi:hypothetical protein